MVTPFPGRASLNTVMARAAVDVPLSVAGVGDVLAGRLVSCLLGHVLFLNSQIPLYVAFLLNVGLQLTAPSPVAQLAKIAANRPAHPQARSVHALLAAFDLLASHLPTTFSALSSALARIHAAQTTHPAAVVHLAFALGPTPSSAVAPSSARARVMLQISGFELKVWGVRHDEHTAPAADCQSAIDDDEPVQIPLSPDTSDSDSEIAAAADDDNDVTKSQFPPSSLLSLPSEQTLQTAERILSRALANANAEGSCSMAADIPPTLTHILIRAPRRFSHPAWIPLQQTSIARHLDAMASSPESASNKATDNNKRSTDHDLVVRVIGILRDATINKSGEEDINAGNSEMEEENMIWWAWNAGKLEGVSGWP